MGESKLPRRRDNKIYGSIWVASDKGDPPWWMHIAPLLILAILAIGCFGLQFLGWDGTSQVGP